MTLLAFEHLSKNFLGVQALKEVSLEFEEGTCTGLIGPNGSGKSTLLQVACGLLSVSGGAIILSNRRLQKVKPYRILKYGITRTFQDGRLIGQMSVIDNLLLAMGERKPLKSLFEWRNADMRNRAEAMLKQVNLWDKRDKCASDLSYGQRKLLEISRAMATGAEAFLLDEPFSGLFPEAIEIIASLIEDMKAKGKTVILIEHNMQLITRLCEHVVVMNAGKILAQGKPEIVLNDPEVLEAYLGK